jgi:hypothetical protein
MKNSIKTVLIFPNQGLGVMFVANSELAVFKPLFGRFEGNF